VIHLRWLNTATLAHYTMKKCVLYIYIRLAMTNNGKFTQTHILWQLSHFLIQVNKKDK